MRRAMSMRERWSGEELQCDLQREHVVNYSGTWGKVTCTETTPLSFSPRLVNEGNRNKKPVQSHLSFIT
jgi:hypothetical protein